MQHDHVLKKLYLELLTPRVMWGGGGGGGLRPKYLLPCCCIRDSIQFDMQYDIVQKKLNFDQWTPPLGSGVGGGGQSCGQNICYHVAAFSIPFNMICNMF